MGSGIGKGLFIIACIIFGFIAVAAGVAFGLTASFHNPLVSAAAGAVVGLALSYLFYQPRYVCLEIAACAGVGGAASAWLGLLWGGGFLAACGGVLCGALITFVSIFAVLIFFPRKGPSKDSWRRGSRPNDTNTN